MYGDDIEEENKRNDVFLENFFFVDYKTIKTSEYFHNINVFNNEKLLNIKANELLLLSRDDFKKLIQYDENKKGFIKLSLDFEEKELIEIFDYFQDNLYLSNLSIEVIFNIYSFSYQLDLYEYRLNFEYYINNNIKWRTFFTLYEKNEKFIIITKKKRFEYNDIKIKLLNFFTKQNYIEDILNNESNWKNLNNLNEEIRVELLTFANEENEATNFTSNTSSSLNLSFLNQNFIKNLLTLIKEKNYHDQTIMVEKENFDIVKLFFSTDSIYFEKLFKEKGEDAIDLTSIVKKEIFNLYYRIINNRTYIMIPEHLKEDFQVFLKKIESNLFAILYESKVISTGFSSTISNYDFHFDITYNEAKFSNDDLTVTSNEIIKCVKVNNPIPKRGKYYWEVSYYS
jgi:hypothetical protein